MEILDELSDEVLPISSRYSPVEPLFSRKLS
jgi:hypothetical protein